MDERRNATDPPAADQFDPLNSGRAFFWRVFAVAVAIVGCLFLFRNDLSHLGFGIAIALCAVAAIALVTSSPYSGRWLAETLPDGAEASGKPPEPAPEASPRDSRPQ